MEKSKKIILLIVAMFLLSSLWLSYISQKQMNPDYQKDWWTLSFDSPKSSSLDFVITNHSKGSNFHWQLLAGTTSLKEGDVSLQPGQNKTVSISPEVAASNSDKKNTIIVTDAKKSVKEIYKNLP